MIIVTTNNLDSDEYRSTTGPRTRIVPQVIDESILIYDDNVIYLFFHN